MKCKIYISDEVFMRFEGLSDAHHRFLYDKLGLPVDGAFFTKQYKLGIWDGKQRFFDKQGRMPIRLFSLVEQQLAAWPYEYEFVDTRPPLNVISERVSENYFAHTAPHMQLRPYQINIVNSCLEHGSGLIDACTGAGKTLICAALSSVLAANHQRVLLIVPSDDLVQQTAETFTEVGLEHGIYSGSHKNLRPMIVIATWQALQYNPVIIEQFQAVINDETHGLKENVLGNMMKTHGVKIPYRFGFTGSIPKNEVNRLHLQSVFGDILHSVTTDELIKAGYLSKLEIEPIEIQEDVNENFPDYTSEKAFLGKSSKRISFIADLIINRQQMYGNTLVLVNSKDMGKKLQKLIKGSVFLHGENNTDERKEWYDQFANRDDLIVIATYGIASTGISINRIFNLVCVDIGKSFTRVIQSIGRSLRKAPDKEYAHVVDLHSSLTWGKKHYKLRVKYYKDARYPLLKLVKPNLKEYEL